MALAVACSGANARDKDAPAPSVAAVDELPPDQSVSETVIELAGWVVASKDNQGYPFAVMDKAAAQVLVFGGDGKLRGAAPALFGSAIGDHSAPGVAKLALSAIPGHDRTTPAGRFIGGYGPSDDAGRVLWVDYDSAVSMHRCRRAAEGKRAERLASPSPDDNRVTHGCINVSPAFYEQIVQSTFEKGGVFYILPDKDSIAKTFPEFAQSRAVTDGNQKDRTARWRVVRLCVRPGRCGHMPGPCRPPGGCDAQSAHGESPACEAWCPEARHAGILRP